MGLRALFNAKNVNITYIILMHINMKLHRIMIYIIYIVNL